MSNRSTHTLDGSPGANFIVHRNINGRYEVTTTSDPTLKVVADRQNDALSRATVEFRDRVLKGTVGSAR